MIFFGDSGSDWTPLNEIEYDLILAFDSDEEMYQQLKKIKNQIFILF
jgi:hypothetical protein